MKRLNWGVIVAIVLYLVIIALALCLYGCSQIIVTKDPNSIKVQINTLFKDIDLDRVTYRDIFVLEQYKGRSKDIKAVTPYGPISVEGQ